MQDNVTQAVKNAADGILAPLCEKVGKFMLEDPERDAIATMADYDVVIPFSRFKDLYDATDEDRLASTTAQTEAVQKLVEALELALEYWAHRQQRYKNRHPAWVKAARAALAAHRESQP
ncbi:hypothetical protein CHH26_11280 [Qipengyuania flava]|uniref:hypothetical protein n=1 Tax=Qipengyuania flava TaxID=192812 RepID=UPI000B8C0A89|nr:hypothetical protein [Qipengyuania flava]ASP30743.1 hypothetical protein CHH26_11280 [Qipengyuania flava]